MAQLRLIYAGLVWYGTFEISYRIRQKINYHKYRRVPQKNKIREKIVPDAIFFWWNYASQYSHKKNVVLGLGTQWPNTDNRR